jgi:hypothetical protein
MCEYVHAYDGENLIDESRGEPLAAILRGVWQGAEIEK